MLAMTVNALPAMRLHLVEMGAVVPRPTPEAFLHMEINVTSAVLKFMNPIVPRVGGARLEPVEVLIEAVDIGTLLYVLRKRGFAVVAQREMFGKLLVGFLALAKL